MSKNYQKILIVSSSAGSGHKQAAKALLEYGQKHYPDKIFKHLDWSDYSGTLFSKVIIQFYNYSVIFFPQIYGSIYKLTDHQLITRAVRLFKFIARGLNKNLTRKIEKFNPDCVISAHFFTPFFVKKDIPIYTVITDHFNVHKIWLLDKNGFYFCANEDVRKTLSEKGFDCLATGLPVRENFYEQIDIEKTKKDFFENADWPMILIMPTAKGKIDPEKAVEKIRARHPKTNILFITGRDKNYSMKETENLKIVKKIENISSVMKAADLIITKPGGITLAECLVMGQRPILINPIPGQEERNEIYFVKENFADKADSINELPDKVKNRLEHPVPKTQTDFKKPAAELIFESIF